MGTLQLLSSGVLGVALLNEVLGVALLGGVLGVALFLSWDLQVALPPGGVLLLSS